MRNKKNNLSVEKSTNRTMKNEYLSTSTSNYLNKGKSNSVKSGLNMKNSNILKKDNINKNKFSNQKSISSLDLKTNLELKECTFKPKLIKIRNQVLKKKLDNYCQWSIYERSKIFMKKKEEDIFINKIFLREQNMNNCKFKPKINKRLKFNKIDKKENHSTIQFYDRMKNSRNRKNFSLTSSIYSIEHSIIPQTRKKDIGNYKKNKNKSMTDKEVLELKKNLHDKLMTIEFNNINEW